MKGFQMSSDFQERCGWVNTSPLYIEYHDKEWGVPVHDDRKLFEFLILEGAQAGLSWFTVLQKRQNYHAAFDNFDPEKIAEYTDTDATRLLSNPGIIRNRLKIAATVNNAQKFLEVQKEFGSFDRYLWNFVGGAPIVNNFATLSDLPARTPISDTLSKDLQKRGFKFVGSTIMYAYMQAVGMVNDHTLNCFIRKGSSPNSYAF
jgi:DNA-3-methyladenine glycosylase I